MFWQLFRNRFGIEQALMFPLGTLKLNVKMNSRPIYLESNFAVLLMLENFFPSRFSVAKFPLQIKKHEAFKKKLLCL